MPLAEVRLTAVRGTCHSWTTGPCIQSPVGPERLPLITKSAHWTRPSHCCYHFLNELGNPILGLQMAHVQNPDGFFAHFKCMRTHTHTLWSLGIRQKWVQLKPWPNNRDLLGAHLYRGTQRGVHIPASPPECAAPQEQVLFLNSSLLFFKITMLALIFVWVCDDKVIFVKYLAEWHMHAY